ncbi:MAG: RNA polymerase sigma factor [Candidatus Omnitrophica bacterium]|nr:RNA polymerase sigma factor [Candidatus Omnitrophota bacterium]
MTTEALVARCVRRDRKAWAEFVREYEGVVRRAVWYKINRMNSKALKSEADDIVQEVFLKLWEDNKLASVRDASKLNSWLVIVAINKTIDYAYRGRKDERRKCSIDAVLNEEGFTLKDILSSGGIDQSMECEIKELTERALKEISNLRKRDRKILDLSLGGTRQTDIAEMMDMRVNTVVSIIRRAKEKVRGRMKECFVS